MTMDETQNETAPDVAPITSPTLLATRDALLADPGATTAAEGLDAARVLLAAHARELAEATGEESHRIEAVAGIKAAEGARAIWYLLRQYADHLDDAAVDSEQQPTPDTLPAWLYQRFARTANTSGWDDLTDDDRSYWAHEAAAVRRAVARGGFKAATR